MYLHNGIGSISSLSYLVCGRIKGAGVPSAKKEEAMTCIRLYSEYGNNYQLINTTVTIITIIC